MAPFSPKVQPPLLEHLNARPGTAPLVIPLGRALLLLGRNGAHVDFEDTAISRNHASLIYVNGKFVLQDNGSASGSFVNGERVTRRELKHDDLLQFGPYRFRVDLGDGKIPAEPDHVVYPLVTIPASHREDHYNLSYDLDSEDPEQPQPITIMTRIDGGRFTPRPCPACEIELEAWFKFCPNCGRKQIDGEVRLTRASNGQ